MGEMLSRLIAFVPSPIKYTDSEKLKSDHPSQYAETLQRVIDATHCQDCDEYVGEDKGHICLDPWLGVGHENHDQDAHYEWIDDHRGGERIKHPPQSIGALIPLRSGPIRQSNTAVIALMKSIESEINRRAQERQE